MSWFKDKINTPELNHSELLSDEERQDRAKATIGKLELDSDDGWERVVIDPDKMKEENVSTNSNTNVSSG
jgi:hypothetical protein